MTRLVPIGLSGTGIKLHASKLGTFFVYTLGLSMLIFKKKSSPRFLGESSELWVLHKNYFLCNTQSFELSPRNMSEDFFLKIGILRAKVYTKSVNFCDLSSTFCHGGPCSRRRHGRNQLSIRSLMLHMYLTG